MASINNIKKISDIGVPPDMSPEEAKHIRMCNVAAFSITAVLLPWTVFQLIELHLINFIIEVIVLALTLLVFKLNKDGRHTQARVHLSIVMNVFILSMCIVSAGALITHYFFFLAAGAVAIGFPKNETKWMAVVILLNVALYHATLFLQGHVDPLYESIRSENFVTNVNIFLEYTLYLGVVMIGLVGRSSAMQAEDRLKEEHERSERLLLNILPKPIAERLKDESGTIADGFSEATVMFADIAGFTRMAENMEPEKMVGLLNEIFSAFDDLAIKYGLEKIKTMGDGYMVAGGLPVERPDHAETAAEMALEMREFLDEFSQRSAQPFGIRIGIHTGPLVAGVIGKSKFAYDLWGDTVNVASRMESHGVDNMIQVTGETYEKLKDKYEFEKRGVIEVKGKGEMVTYFLQGRKA